MDMADIQELLGVAASAVGLTKQAASTVGEVRKALTDKEGAASAEMQGLLNTLAAQLTSANMTNLQLSALLKEVSAKLQAEDTFAERRRRYRLVDNGYGELLWALREELRGDEPPHFVCPKCLEKSREFHFVTGSPTSDGKHCQGCNFFFRFRAHSSIRY